LQENLGKTIKLGNKIIVEAAHIYTHEIPEEKHKISAKLGGAISKILMQVEFLIRNFPDYTVIPVHLKQPSENEDVLHLDCAFLPVGKTKGLIYLPGFSKIPKEIKENYELEKITKKEQEDLQTNVLSISPKAVISTPNAERVNSIMESWGIEIFRIEFSESKKTGGSFRCASLPLEHE